MLSQVVGDHERGLYMGLQQTVGNITRVLYALFAGTAWDLGHARFGQAGSFIPFFSSAALVAATSLLAVKVPEEDRGAAGKALRAFSALLQRSSAPSFLHCVTITFTLSAFPSLDARTSDQPTSVAVIIPSAAAFTRSVSELVQVIVRPSSALPAPSTRSASRRIA
jgi:hypothetical protein